MYLSVFAVPSAPQNLTADYISDEEVHLSWAPPLSSKIHIIHNAPSDTKQASLAAAKDLQNDDPNDVIKDITPETSEDSYESYRNDAKYNDEISSSAILMDTYRSKPHRHRKRRQQENATEAVRFQNFDFGQTEFTKKILKKSLLQKPLTDSSDLAYVLYYEQGNPRNDVIIKGVQKPEDVRLNHFFPSDVGITDSDKYPVKNLTLHNTSGKVTKVVGFWLKNLSK